MADDTDFSDLPVPPQQQAAPAAAPDVSDLPDPAAAFKRDVGRDPENAYEQQQYIEHPENFGGARGNAWRAAHPSKLGLFDMPAGVAETGANFITGGVIAPLAGGLTYLGTLANTRDPDAAKAVQEATEDKLTYVPKYSSFGEEMSQAPGLIVAQALKSTHGKEAYQSVRDHMEQLYGDRFVSSVEANLEMLGAGLMNAPGGAIVKGGLEAAARAGERGAAAAAGAVRGGAIPEGTTFDRGGTAQAPGALPGGSKGRVLDAHQNSAGEWTTDDFEALPAPEAPGKPQEPSSGTPPQGPTPEQPAAAAPKAANPEADRPQDRFLADLDASSEPHPENPAVRRVNSNVKVDATRDPFDPNTVHIAELHADEPAKGQGGRAMEQLTKLADQHGVTLTLDAIPQRSAKGLIPQEKLDAFYKAHGFEPEETSESTAGAMRREPRGPEVNAPPMAGMPQVVPVNGKPVKFGPTPAARTAAHDYMKEAGLEHQPPNVFEPITPSRGKLVADAYEAMPHNPNDPETKAAYDALIKETVAQWKAIEKTGLKVDFKPYPYGENPRLAVMDVRNNNHLTVFPTEEGEGGASAAPKDHPMLQPTDITIDGRKLNANDVFRIVHDYFGHVKEGNGFRADGEYNAYRIHKAMYSPLAQKALATETLGQNAWVNYGPKSGANKGADQAKTAYAEQKAGLLPDEVLKAADVPSSQWVNSVHAAPTPPGAQAPAGAQPPSTQARTRFRLPSEEGAVTEAVPAHEQDSNAAILKRALPQLSEVRTSALARDYHETGNDYQSSKLKDAVGARAREVINNEQNAMRQEVARMGSNTDTSPTAEAQRGNTIADAIDTAVDAFKKHDESMYEAAKAQASQAPAKLDSFQGITKAAPDGTPPAAFLASVDGKQLYQGVMARAKELGLTGSNGTFNPATATQIEQLRQFVGESWSPRTSKLVGQLKDALDDDLAQSMGKNVFEGARANREMRSKLFERNNAVEKFLPPDDGIEANRKVQSEKIMGALSSPATSVEQFKSVFDSLKSAIRYFDQVGDKATADALKQKVAAAHNAVRDHFASNALKAGQKIERGWDQKSFSQYLAQNEPKMASILKPVDMQRWQDLNDAGNILKMDRTYPGAHAQEVNTSAVRGRIADAAEAGLAAAGAHTMGLPGALAGEVAGRKVGGFLRGNPEKKALDAYEKRVTNLDTYKPQAEQMDQTLGQTLGGGKQRGGPKWTPGNPYDSAPPNKDVWGNERTKNDRTGAPQKPAAQAPRSNDPYNSGQPLGAKLFGGKQRGAVGNLNRVKPHFAKAAKRLESLRTESNERK